jgi:hypothetical protein
MISEVFMLEEDGSWWIDSCATKHICKDMSLFKTFETVEDECVLFMENSSTDVVKGKRTLNLKFTSGKILLLTNVYFVLEIHNKFEFKPVFESCQFVGQRRYFFREELYVLRDV